MPGDPLSDHGLIEIRHGNMPRLEASQTARMGHRNERFLIERIAMGPIVVEVTLSDVVQPVSADHIVRGIRHANEISAAAVLLTINTPGGL